MKVKKINYCAARHLRAVIRRRNIDLVIDVGANEGQFGSFLRKEVGYRGKILSFEPANYAHSRLSAAAQSDRDWQVVKAAAGSKSESLVLNITSESVFNSFKKPIHDIFLDCNIISSSEIVDVYRLDEYLVDKKITSERIFLKVDTQGFDLEVIHGSLGIINSVEAIQTELSFIPIYETMPTFKDVLDELQKRDFVISNMTPVSLTNLQAIEFDCLLVRKPPQRAGEHSSYEKFILTA